MADLIPTRIVDRNGRTTTVHKKLNGAAKSTVLGGIKPVLTGKQPEPRNQVHAIKGKMLDAASLSLELLSDDEPKQYRLTSCSGEFEWRKKVEMPDGELYKYLSLGVDAQDAAALHGLGVSADDLPNHPKLAVHVPGRLGRYDGQDSYYIVSNRKVIQRFQEAGISALDAEKAIANKIQDAFLDKALDEHQLLRLFSHKKYSTPHEMRLRTRTNDRVTYCFVQGRLPMSVVDMNYKELREISAELVMMNDAQFASMSADPALFEALIRKAADAVDDSRRLESLHSLVSQHGPAVLEMDDPFLCAVVTGNDGSENGGITGGVDSVLYFDEVYRMLKESGRKHGKQHPYDWWGGYSSEGISLKNHELEVLRKAGLTPQEAYDGLVLNKMDVDRLVVAHESGIPESLSNGAL